MTNKKAIEYFEKIKKRDGKIVPFHQSRITAAILKAMKATVEGDEKAAEKVSGKVIKTLMKNYPKGTVLGIEQIQNAVEEALMLEDYFQTAKAYILYRREREKLREKTREIPEHVKKLVEESRKYLKTPVQEFIAFRSYCRWIEEEARRETWVEAVRRYIDFMKENLGSKLSEEEYQEIHQAILKLESMPSMRLLWSAGKAARSTHAAAYNCSFIAVQSIKDLAEIMYLSMCGTGVGFSVEQQNVQRFPQIKKQSGEVFPTYAVEDSKEGWSDALVAGLEVWFNGKDIKFDFSKLRPQGARLKTMGGKSSGPQPLIDLLKYTRAKILSKQGKRLSPIDVHDIVCMIGEVVVMGGMRRTALISLSDLDDQEMRFAKTGTFYNMEKQRERANNSAVYVEKPSVTELLEEWLALAKSGTGERGIFNRGSLQKQLPARRWKVFEKDSETCGTNPCGEIVLKSKQFCNLSEVVCRPEDTKESLLEKIRIAAIIGTYQSTLTNFPYLSPEWKKNCEEERLLGVSLTGHWDCPAVRNPETLRKLREKAFEVNKEYAKRFGINPSTAITCVKPSGTVSHLVDSASGMHARHSKFYIRRFRIASTDSLFKMLRDQKVPLHPETGQSVESATTYVLDFPIKAPENAIFRNDLSAIEQLEYWRMVKENYTEHNPSATISVGKDEWIAVVHWLYENWEMIGGLSFLPREEHVYKLAPYEEISEEEYAKLASEFPHIDYSQILFYEKDDETEGAKEAACVGGICELTM